MSEKKIASYYPESRKQWRAWLKKNHSKEQSVWLICYKKESGKPSISWSDAVDEALCFGWIDSTRKTLDHESFTQFFSKRKAKSTWSKINKVKVEQLVEKGLMQPAGLVSIETAKQNGSWTILDEVEELTLPAELVKAFKSRPGSKKFFEGLSRSVRKMMLHSIAMAKRPETKTRRITEIADCAAKKQRPKQFMF